MLLPMKRFPECFTCESVLGMAKSVESDERQQGGDDTMERMNKALTKVLETPPETHEDMVKRRQKVAKKARK